ncbi:hypothetical protein DLAC_02857 [Tieghemostelium lacteum]|uniref:AD domain-containing protein n=1 Tax=Tieghemostelium lacteum TaxID=361077 RepID=A0A152A3M5_TIELA|nr:hypothetical protein DLAC_02857 [Tieghemostelium lacteum]|eukprot:KYR00804.1 hypothetical protein DLAC_02857 [Tieghemostelium lacteum]
MDHDKLSWVIGLKVRIKTTQDEVIEGEIFNYDSITTCITILSEDPKVTCIAIPLQPPTTPTNNSKISNNNHTNNNNVNDNLILPPININSVLKRRDQAFAKENEKALKIGIGVTKEAQEIFNSLSKTLPCSWSGSTIVVLGGDVKITSPYVVENCTGTNNNTINRVKTVLEAERKKLKI